MFTLRVKDERYQRAECRISNTLWNHKDLTPIQISNLCNVNIHVVRIILNEGVARLWYRVSEGDIYNWLRHHSTWTGTQVTGDIDEDDENEFIDQ